MSEESPISYSQLRDLEDDFEDIDLQMRKLTYPSKRHAARALFPSKEYWLTKNHLVQSASRML